MRKIFVGLLALICSVVGCKCDNDSDEALLKKKIDTTSIHLYLATKIAILKADQSPEAKAARDQLLLLIDSAQGKTSKSTAPKKLTAGDYLKLAKALYHLRKEGKELLESGNEKGLAPVIPKLLTLAPELAKLFDLPTEHAVLLTAWFVLRLHPKNPLPIPEEILLYEAWMTDTSKIKLPGLDSLAANIKAYVYATNGLCDLAKKEGSIADGLSAKGLSKTVRLMSGGKGSLDEKQTQAADAAVRMVAHGATAYCYYQRGEKEKALDELDKFVAAAHQAGVPKGETAMLRAFVAYERKDYKATAVLLKEARDYPGTDPAAKQEIEQLITQVEGDEPSKVQSYFGKSYFAVYTVKVALGHLERAGVFDELSDSAMVSKIIGYATALSKTLHDTEKALPSVGGCN